jgi:ABC-type spermidine/putrescine transport system permease subunit II
MTAPPSVGQAQRWRHAGALECVALATLLLVVLLPPAFVLLYAASERWDRSLWPEGATLHWFVELGQDPRVTSATARTLVVAAVNALLATGLGCAATLAAQLYAPALKAVLDGLAQLPYAVPPVVVAISALEVFVGGLGGLGLAIDPRLLYVLLLTPLLFPLVHRTLSAALLRLELQTLLEAGRTLGASDALTLRRVVLPLLMPAIAAAALLCVLTAALEFAIANLLLGGENELLQPMMNSLRATSGHRSAALVIGSFAVVGLAAALVQALAESRER